ncbi:MAG: hypothetical protein PHU61_03525 [Candidatus Absconditabacteria bacterium]|nr:hypothetical protein [Candidatus Absconditabacteria bacterium]MDD3868389.1 hypothetical protein [Candidatus Absconditabacteria bacterium]MDD4714472.1 hypothetical protein [Candidatus Absconditabacteria bacterium]
MKKVLKRIPLTKKESERTKTEKLIRDVAFFAVVIFTAITAFTTLSIQADLVEMEAQLASSYLLQ